MLRLIVFVASLVILTACNTAPQAPCSDADPVGPCATSHSHTYDGGGKP